jgi:hypothetical protein
MGFEVRPVMIVFQKIIRILKLTNMKTKKQLLKILFSVALISTTFSAKAQVEQESLDFSKLRIRAYLDIPIPYTELKEINLASIATVQAAYELGTIADVRVAGHMGTFKGVSLGATYHMKDELVDGKTRFIVAETGDKVYFYKGTSEYRSVFGPSVDLMAGVFGDAGLYARLQGGLEWQTHSRAYYNGYPAMRNGIMTTKLHAVATSMGMAEYHNGSESYVRRIGLGGVVGMTYEIRPWKRITMFGGVDLGYLFIPGVENDLTNGIENTKAHPILEIKFGGSVKI